MADTFRVWRLLAAALCARLAGRPLACHANRDARLATVRDEKAAWAKELELHAELFQQLPWRRQILEGLLGSTILGFHTRYHGQNFLEAVDRFLEARIEHESSTVSFGGRRTRGEAFPITIAWPDGGAGKPIEALPVDKNPDAVAADLAISVK